MALFGTAVQLTIKTQLWQMTMMQQIDRHRVALRALEARIAMDSGPRGGGDDGRRSTARDGVDAVHDAETDWVLLTARLPSPVWRRTRDTIDGNGWTLCWRENIRGKDRLPNDTDYEKTALAENRVEGEIDARRCQSLALP
ncbi:hypothetical protein [Robbsia sp. KACC 23696]|uniref:hypothetical protein n=1 Tax=Robbsia sp. KACC 23696 TaxID=3149231 RepID=UPI00325AB352